MLNSRNRYGNLSKLIIEILIVIDFGVRLFTRNFFEVLFSKSFRGLFFNLLFHSFSFRNNSVSVLYVDNNKSKIFYRFFSRSLHLFNFSPTIFPHQVLTSVFPSLYIYTYLVILFLLLLFSKLTNLWNMDCFFNILSFVFLM